MGWFREVRARLYQSRRPQIVTVSDAPLIQAEAEKLKAENQELRKLLGANLPASWQFIPAKILSLKDGRLTLSAGSKDGAQAGMNVLVLAEAESHTGILIGKISRVDPYLAQVDLITDARVRTSAGATGKIKRQNLSLELLEVEQKHSLNQGDLIVSEGKDGWLPDLLVGRVGKIDNVPTAIYQSAQVESIIDLDTVSRVFVVKLNASKL